MIEELKEISIDLKLQQLITPEQAWLYKIIPCHVGEDEIAFYADSVLFNPNDENVLEVILGKKVVIKNVDGAIIRQALGKFYRKVEHGPKPGKSGTHSGDFLESILMEAKGLGSSDIHIEIYENQARVRFRIDGLLVERHQISKDIYPSLINKIKIQGNLDIAEKRLPQDGRIFNQSEGSKMDIRVSVMPSLHGEKIVLRLLNQDSSGLDIDLLGMSIDQLSQYKRGIGKPHGIVLISGPTGSGKTTTLYASLKYLNKNTRNILTIEDPIEYTLEGINQVQLREDIGLTFASTLRTFLRQDPDIIMVGEIRDQDTARMAIRASMTGHLVLSTIHTNSATETISRLRDLGIPSYLIASTLNLSVAQRLVRLLCPSCKLPYENHYKAQGCPECHYTGYYGRKAIYEVILIEPELANLIKNDHPSLEDFVRKKGGWSLTDSANELLNGGLTSQEEVLPITALS